MILQWKDIIKLLYGGGKIVLCLGALCYNKLSLDGEKAMIYYVRHGETEDNVKGISTGRSDIELNNNGLNQAKQTAQKLKDIKFDIAFCSPLKRARQTLQEIIKFHPNLQVIFDERVTERDYGVLTGYQEKQFTFNRWDYNGNYDDYKGMESPAKIYNRAKTFYDDIKQTYANKTILLVGHGGFGRATWCYFNGLPQSGDLSEVWLNNASVSKYNL